MATVVNILTIAVKESEDNDVALLEDDPHRDRWFLAFQRILELPAKDRHEPLNRIIEQFLDTAERIGKRVIQVSYQCRMCHNMCS